MWFSLSSAGNRLRLGLTLVLAIFCSIHAIGQHIYFNNTYSYKPHNYSIALGALALENGNFITTEQFSPYTNRYGTVVKEYNSHGVIIDSAVFLDPGYNVSPGWPSWPIEIDGKVYFRSFRRIGPAMVHGLLFSYKDGQIRELATCIYQDSVSTSGQCIKSKGDKIYMFGDSFKFQSDSLYYKYRHQAYISQYDTSGTKIWENFYTAQEGYWELTGHTIDATIDGGYIAGGRAFYEPHDQDEKFTGAFVLLTDSLGNKIADRYFPNDTLGNDEAHVLQLDNGNYLVAYTHAIDAQYSYPFRTIQSWYRTRELVLTELDRYTLETVWEKRNLKEGWLNCLQISKLVRQSDSTYLLFGDRFGDNNNWDPHPAPGWIYAFNQNGDSIWYREYAHQQGINEGHRVMGGSLAPEGGILMGGYTQIDTTGASGLRTWLVKLDSIGCPYEGCDTVYYEKILDYNLYPNPTSGELTLEIPEVQTAEIILYDLSGRLILRKPVKLDHGATRFNLFEGLIPAKGVYIMQILTDDRRQIVERIQVYSQ